MNDPKLLRQLKAGDEKAFRTLVEQHQRLIYSVCFRILSDSAEAEELTQETFIRAFQAIPAFEDRAKLSTWMCKIAVNLCYNRVQYLKRRGSQAKRSIEAFVGDAWETQVEGRAPLTGHIQSPEEALTTVETEALLTRALSMLSESLRSLVVLRDVEGVSYQEICEITELPIGTVKSRLHRARGELVRLYEGLQRGDIQ